MTTSDGRGEIMPPSSDQSLPPKNESPARQKKNGLQGWHIFGLAGIVIAGAILGLLFLLIVALYYVLHHPDQLPPVGTGWIVLILGSMIIAATLVGFISLKFAKWIGKIIVSDDEDEGRKRTVINPPSIPPAPIKKEHTKIKWGKIVFWTITLVLGIILIHWIFYGGGKNRFFSSTPPPPIIHSNFHPRIVCEDAKERDYSQRDTTSDGDTIKITLNEKCYGDSYVMPLAWDKYIVQLSDKDDDYVSVWCNGDEYPRPIVEHYQHGLLEAQIGTTCHARGEMTSDFRFQGHGTILLKAKSKRSYWTGRWLR